VKAEEPNLTAAYIKTIFKDYPCAGCKYEERCPVYTRCFRFSRWVKKTWKKVVKPFR